MEITLKQEQIPEALRTVKEWNLGATSFMVQGTLKSMHDNPIGFDISVDKWPDFSILMMTAGENYPFNFMSEVMHFIAKDGANVRDCILNYDWKDRKSLIIGCCPMQYENVYKDLINQLNGEILYFSMMHYMSTDATSLKPCTLADGYTSGVLEEQDAEFINANWDFADDNSVEVVCYHIQCHPNVAIRTKEGDLVAWEIQYSHGAMGMLYVMEKHRGKGLAKFVIFKLASNIIKLGDHAFCFIENHNRTSFDLHLKCGFSVNEGHDVNFTKLAVK